MTLAEFGPMMRRQEREALDRRADRERRLTAMRDRRGRRRPVPEEAPVACASCGEARPADAMVLTGDDERCSTCVAALELPVRADRSLRKLRHAALAGAAISTLLTAISGLVLIANIPAALLTLVVSVATAGAGWSAWRRASSLLETRDLLPIHEGNARRTGRVGLAVLVLGTTLAVAAPTAWGASGWAVGHAPDAVRQHIHEYTSDLLPDPLDALGPSGAADHVIRVHRNPPDRAYWERKRKALEPWLPDMDEHTSGEGR